MIDYKIHDYGSELIGSLKLVNVWDFVQLIHRQTWTKISCTKTQTLPNLRLHIRYDTDVGHLIRHPLNPVKEKCAMILGKTFMLLRG